MKKKFTKFVSAVALLLTAAVLFSACGKPLGSGGNVAAGNDSNGSGNSSSENGGSQESSGSEVTMSYEDAMAAKNYEAAYRALLADPTEENKAEMKKFFFVPVSVKGKDPNKGDPFTAAFTYNEKGWLVKMEVPLSRKAYSTEYGYDENGRVVSVKKGRVDSESYDLETYTYDEAGHMLSHSIFYNADELQRKWEWTYNEQGDKLSEKETDSFGEENLVTYSYTYDEAGRKLTEVSGNHKDEWTYDEKGNELTKKSYYEGELNAIYSYEYDDQGRLIKDRWEDVESDPSESSWSQNEFIYDANGNRHYKSVTRSDGDNLSYEHEYNEAGNVIKMTRTEDGKVTMVRTYDAAGNLLTSDFTGEDRCEKIAFTYDDFGNRMSEGYTNSSEYSYEYAVIYEIKYFPEGVPDNSEIIEDIRETSSMRYFF